MELNARVEPRLRWFRPRQVERSGPQSLRVDSGSSYEVEPLTVLRGFVIEFGQLLRSEGDADAALKFVRQHGPLFEPHADEINVSELVAARRTITQVIKNWISLDARRLVASQKEGQSLDAETQKHWRMVGAAFGAKVPLPDDLIAARQESVAPLLKQVRLNTRLEMHRGALVLRPGDLHAVMWLWLSERFAVGDASIDCRRVGCENIVRRALADGDTMRAVYCEEGGDTCRKIVEREWKRGNKRIDRYPEMRELNERQKRDFARKLRGDHLI